MAGYNISYDSEFETHNYMFVQTLEDGRNVFRHTFDNFLHIFSILPAGIIELNEYSLNTVSVAELQSLKSLTNCMMSHKIVKGPESN